MTKENNDEIVYDSYLWDNVLKKNIKYAYLQVTFFWIHEVDTKGITFHKLVKIHS